MNPVLLNSKLIVVEVPRIADTLVEVSDIARKVGQYGNILGYQLKQKNSTTQVYFKLSEDFSKFRAGEDYGPNATSFQEGQRVIDPNSNEMFEVHETIMTPGGDEVVRVDDPASPENVKYIKKTDFETKYQPVEGF